MENTIKKIISEILEVEVDSIHNDALIMEDLGADSIAVMEIVMELESEADIEVPTEDVLKLKTVTDILNYINEK